MLMAAIPIVCAAGVTQQPKSRPVEFAKWGVVVQIPLAAVRHKCAVQEPVQLSEVFVFGDLIYSVMVTKAPPETLTATAIEKALQTRAAAGQAETTRWEIDTKEWGLFKGVSGPVSPDEAVPESPYLQKAFWGRKGWRSLCMAALGDESAPMLTLAVTGPKTRAGEIEDLAKFLAVGVGKPGTKPLPAPPVVASTPEPEPAKPFPLKKGKIELTGLVESIDQSTKRLTMIVDAIRMPSTRPIQLDPPRRKAVYYDTLPPGLEADKGVRVVGKNTGVGQPMKADVVQAM